MKGFLFFDPLTGLDFIVHGFSTKPQGFRSAEEALNGLGLKGIRSRFTGRISWSSKKERPRSTPWPTGR